MMLRQRCIASDHVLLDDDTASHRFDGAVENCQKAVAGRFDKLTVVLDDGRLYEVAHDPFHTLVRSFLIDLHETAVASDIACDNRGKTARHRPARGLIANL